MTVLLAGAGALAAFTGYLFIRRWLKYRYRTNGKVTAGASPEDWFIGPIVWGENRSNGMPLHPSPEPSALFAFDFPQEPGSVHYVTYRHGPLTGKKQIRMRYRIEADPDVEIVPLTDPAGSSKITLYFQRYGDDWSGKGKFDGYRWFDYWKTIEPITVGEFEIVASFDDDVWNAVQSSTSVSSPAAFYGALGNADQVGVVFGGGTGLGHGVFATGRARFVMIEFAVE